MAHCGASFCQHLPPAFADAEYRCWFVSGGPGWEGW